MGSSLKRKWCHKCNKNRFLFMFQKVGEGWFSRDGRKYCCKICNSSSNVRYRKVPTNTMTRLEPYTVGYWERIKDWFQ